MQDYTDLVKNFKDVIISIIAGTAGAFTHIAHQQIKWNAISFWNWVRHTLISGFIWMLAYFLCDIYWMDGSARWFIIGISSYMWVILLDGLMMIKPKEIKEIILDFLRYTLKYIVWKK